MTTKLNKHDKLSFAFHAAVKRELISDPERVLTIAKNNLKRWRENYNDIPKWMADWNKIIEKGASDVVNVLDGKDEESTLLRSSSPFTGVISQTERMEIIIKYGESENAHTE